MPPRSLLLRFLLLAVMTPMSDLPRAVADTYQQATLAYQRAKWQSAAALFQTAANELRNFETRESAHFFAGECLVQLGRYAEAHEHFLRVIESSNAIRYQSRAAFRLAEAVLLSGNPLEAKTALRQFIERYPLDTLALDASNYLGELALDAGDSAQAIKAYSQVIEMQPTPTQESTARLGLARAHLISDQWDLVPVALGDLCQAADHNLRLQALLIQGSAEYDSLQFDQALANFRRASQTPGQPSQQNRARIAAGWSLWKLSRWDAIAREIAPLGNDAQLGPECHYLLGMTAYAEQNWEKAIAELSLAMNDATAPHRSASMFYLGECCLQSKKYSQAMQWFEQLVAEYLDSSWADDALWGLARVARSTKSEADFSQACKRLKAKFPASEYLRQATAKSSTGTMGLAEHSEVPSPGYRSKEYQLDSKRPLLPTDNSPGAETFEEAVRLERDGFFDAALAAYLDYLEQPAAGGLQAEALWRAAGLYERLQRYSLATSLLERLLRDFPTDDRSDQILARLARIEATAGNTDKAAKHCQQLLEKFPQSPQAAEAAYRLALAAADKHDSTSAGRYLAWLFDAIGTVDASSSESLVLLRAQGVCLKCQLAAKEGRWQEIAELVDSVKVGSELGPLAARLSFWRAEADFRLHRNKEAWQRFEKLVPQVVGLTEAWVPMVSLRQAQLAAQQQQWTFVRELVGRLDAHHPEFELAYEVDYLRGRAAAERGEMTAARSAYRDVLQNELAAGTETAAMAQWMIGEIYFHQRNYEQAKQAFGAVIDNHEFTDWQSRAALQAGKCAELQQHWDEAHGIYSKALDECPDSDASPELAARIQWAKQHEMTK